MGLAGKAVRSAGYFTGVGGLKFLGGEEMVNLYTILLGHCQYMQE
jgi:hypothetical protein